MRVNEMWRSVALGFCVASAVHAIALIVAGRGYLVKAVERFLWPGYAPFEWYWGGAREFPLPFLALILNVVFYALVFGLILRVCIPFGAQTSARCHPGPN